MEKITYACILGSTASMLVVAFIGWRLFLSGRRRMGNFALALSLGVLATLAVRPPDALQASGGSPALIVEFRPWFIRGASSRGSGESVGGESGRSGGDRVESIGVGGVSMVGGRLSTADGDDTE